MKKIITTLIIMLMLIGIQTLTYAYEGEYQQSQENGQGFELSVNGHDMEFVYSSGAYGNLYSDGEFIDRGVLWRFFSNGHYIYYTKNSNIYRFDLNTHDKVSILLDNDTPFIEGIYGDKYLYYSSGKYSDVTLSLQDLIIYDLENSKEITYIEDVGTIELSEQYIFVEPCTGDLCPLDIRQFNLDGSDGKTIINDASAMKVIDNTLYYSAIKLSNWEDAYVRSKVKSYNINTGVISELTDEYARTVVVDFTPSYAVFQDIATLEKYIEYYNSPQIRVLLNGSELSFEQPPIIKDDRTLVPMRAIFEAMGATVDWEDSTKTVTSKKGSTTITVTIDNNIMYKNNVETYLDVPAQLIGDYTMVPVRAVAESFGADVTWDESTRTICIDINTKTHGIVIYADAKYNEIAAQSFTEILRNNQLGTNAQDVHCRYEPSEDEYNQILSLVRQNSKDEDITYFFYAGHGDDDGGIYPDYNNDSNVDTYMKTPTQLISDLQDIPGTIIVILESCHSGCIQNVENLDRNKFKIITSSTENQYSDTDHLGIVGYVKDKRLGAFSEALLNGLGGLEGTNIIYNTITGRDGTVKADYNNDRSVTISELFTYIDDNMDHEYWYQFNLFKQDPTCSNANDQTVIYAY